MDRQVAVEDQSAYAGNTEPGVPERRLNPPNSFQPETIQRLPHMSLEELSQLEEEISHEFSAVSHELVAARMGRLEYLMETIDAQISRFQQQDAAWADVYNSQIQTVETLTTNTEDSVLNAAEFLGDAEFGAQLAHLMESSKSPLDLDDIFMSGKEKLPFAEHFKEIIELHLGQLVASANQKTYQLDMVDSLAEKNRVTLWKQYRHDVMEYKEKLIAEVTSQLASLHNEHLRVNENKTTADANKRYYRSVVPLQDMKHTQDPDLSTKTDKHYGVDNVYYKNNRIEITDAKLAAVRRMQAFAAAQNAHTIPQLENLTVRLAGCYGLSKSETDADMALLRMGARRVKTESSGEVDSLQNPLERSSPPDSPTQAFDAQQFDTPIKRNKTPAVAGETPLSENSPASELNSDYQRILNMNRIPTHNLMAGSR